MLYDPAWEKEKEAEITLQGHEKRDHSLLVYDRWFKFKEHVLVGLHKKKKVSVDTSKKRIKLSLFK